MRITFLAFALSLAALPLCAAEPADQDELMTIAARLGSREFVVRQEATRLLEEAGPAAIPALSHAIQTGDGEARSRAIGVLTRHAFGSEHAWRALARAALVELCSSANPQAARAAREATRDVERQIVALASAELTEFGAHVMPQRPNNTETARDNVINVQIGQGWRGGDSRLSLLVDLGGVPWLSLENAPVSDAGLVHVGKLAKLERLYLGSSRVRGNGFRELASLSQLKYLSLKQLPIDDAKLATLPELPALQDLGLDYTRITNDGLAHLSRYPQLGRLWLDHTQVTDEGLAHLAKLSNLKTLFLPGTNTAGPGLAELRHLSGLTYLSLKEVKLQPKSAKYIAQLEQLETLGLDHTNVTDDQLAELAPLQNLRILWLSKTDVSDQGLKHLHELKNLQVVYLHGSQVSSEGADELRRALPQCHVAR